MRPPAESFSSFVRLLLKQAVRREKMAEAARQYAGLLGAKGEEREWMDGWEAADLSRPPRKAKVSASR